MADTVEGVIDRYAAETHAVRASAALDNAREAQHQVGRVNYAEGRRDMYLRVAEVEAELSRTAVLYQLLKAFQDKRFTNNG